MHKCLFTNVPMYSALRVMVLICIVWGETLRRAYIINIRLGCGAANIWRMSPEEVRGRDHCGNSLCVDTYSLNTQYTDLTKPRKAVEGS